MTTYTTVLGDAWDMIAKKVYGDELKADILMQANFDLLDTFIFSAGTVIKVPELEEPKGNNLPAWRN